MNRNWMWVTSACVGILAAHWGAALAQDAAAAPKNPDQLRQENEALRRENEKLRARLAELEHVAVQEPAPEPVPAVPRADAPPATTAIAPTLDELLDPEACADGEEKRGGDNYLLDHDKHPRDLTLWNLFSVGWRDAYTERDSTDRAPDMALLRVQTNFMEREIRLNYAYTRNFNSATKDNLTNLDYLVAWSFNRRLMIEVLGNYQWQDGRGLKNPDLSGQAGQFVGRLQLVSTQDSSYSFNFRVVSPDVSLGAHDTNISYGLAGFEDLTRFGLYRVGLYASALFDSNAGPFTTGATRNDVQYDITIAKTLTRPDMPFLGNLSFFVENFAQTNLDGAHASSTLVSITPGFRFNLGQLKFLNIGKNNWIMGGVDIPVSGPQPWDAIYRLTYIKNF